MLSFQSEDHGRIKKVELDIFLPKERLAFEYQGRQHYSDVFPSQSAWIQQKRDKNKKKICEAQEITLIEVPHWWDFEKSSLIATVHQRAPHLNSLTGEIEFQVN